MATMSRRKHKGGSGRYCYRGWNHNHTRQLDLSLDTTTLSVAQRRFVDLDDRVHRGQPMEEITKQLPWLRMPRTCQPKTPPLTFSHLMGACMKYWHRTRPKTYRFFKFCTRRLVRYFKNRKVEDITKADVKNFKLERLRTVGPSTVNHDLAVGRRALNLAKDWGLITGLENPFVRLMEKAPRGRIRYLETHEIKLLIEHCDQKVKEMVIVAVMTGLRIGEMLKLQWQHVNFTNNRIIPEDAKNGESWPVPMCDKVRSVLWARSTGKQPEDFVFSLGKGVPYDYKAVRGWLKKATTAAELKGVTFHVLRHTFISQLIQSGTHMVTMKELARHKSVAMTMRYSHISQGTKEEAVKGLERHLGNAL